MLYSGMEQVDFTPSVVAITGGTIVGVTLSGVNIVGSSTFSGGTIGNTILSGSNFIGGNISGSALLGVTISGSSVIASSTLSGNTIIGGSISGAAITTGTISGATIAASNISGGTMVSTALSGVSINNPTILVGTISGSIISAPTISGGTHVGGTLSGNTIISPTISGGTINNTIIGGVTPVSGTFTNLTASTLLTATAVNFGVSGVANANFNIRGLDETTNHYWQVGSDAASAGFHVYDQTTGSYRFIIKAADGALVFNSATDASSSTTGSIITAGGAGVAKKLYVGSTLDVTGNFISRLGAGLGVTSTATAAATTTLTSSSTSVQIFTGSTTQTVQLPAANLYGSGVAVIFIIKNRSTGSVTVNRAGSDTIDGLTSLVIPGGASETLASDGVSDWVRI